MPWQTRDGERVEFRSGKCLIWDSATNWLRLADNEEAAKRDNGQELVWSAPIPGSEGDKTSNRPEDLRSFVFMARVIGLAQAKPEINVRGPTRTDSGNYYVVFVAM